MSCSGNAQFILINMEQAQKQWAFEKTAGLGWYRANQMNKVMP